MKKLIRLHFYNADTNLYVLTDNTNRAIMRIHELYDYLDLDVSVSTNQNQKVQANDIQLIFSDNKKLQNQL